MKYNINLNGKKYEVEVERGQAEVVSVADIAPVAAAPAPVAAAAPAPAAPAAPAAAATAAGEKVASPMPGTILDIRVSQGQSVNAGDILMILEAMKMENEIVAPKAGTVAQIVVAKGAGVQTGDVLAVIA